ncbi:MAG TPA: aromatic ring-hydroxylating dioxygenase subunit alpha [Stellaceae bacterium]|nr:aromatic ring-hydroxylating dioxygenase subunit alpha [Stellaceae bacterium]
MDAQSTPPLRDLWYYALPGHRLKRGKMLTKTMLGEPVLLGRDAAGKPFAMIDICPHRGIPLSFGTFDGKEIECCYHGWRFDCQGGCTLIPTLVEDQQVDLAKVRVKPYPAAEVQGNIWVFFGDDPANAPPIPVLPELENQRYKMVETMLFKGGIDHAVIGLVDPAHATFVHASWFWRSKKAIRDKAKRFEPSTLGFTMARHPPSSNTRAYKLLGGRPETEIVFQLPGVRYEHIKIGRHVMCHLTALTPINDTETEINHTIYWTMPWLDPLRPIFRPFARAFLAQDRDVISKQQLGLVHNPQLLLLGDPDVQARWYLRLKNEFERSRAEARDFVNPLKPRTLRWRS